MASSVVDQKTQTQTITVEDINRLLEVGRLLFSVLTPDEIKSLQEKFAESSARDGIGNTGDS